MSAALRFLMLTVVVIGNTFEICVRSLFYFTPSHEIFSLSHALFVVIIVTAAWIHNFSRCALARPLARTARDKQRRVQPDSHLGKPAAVV